MKITISGSLGNIGKHLAQILINQGHDLTVISSNADKTTAIEKIGAKAAIGSINDVPFLTSAFTGADAVFVMTPPNMGGKNIIQHTVDAGKAFTAAIQATGIKKVVMLSSIGADYENGTGPIKGLHHIEQLYKKLDHSTVTFLRAGYFYNNYFNDIPMIKHAGIMGANYPADIKIPLVHPADVALAAAEELTKNSSGHNVRYIVSDFTTMTELTKTFGKAIGSPDLKWVEFSDEQALNGMIEAGMPSEIAGLYMEMGQAIRNNKLQSDFETNGKPITGAIKIAEFAKEFANQFN